MYWVPITKQVFGTLFYPIGTTVRLKSELIKIGIILILVVYFNLIIYIDCSDKVVFIVSGVFALVISGIKLAVYIIDQILDHAVDVPFDLLGQEEKEQIPDGISPDLYHKRHLLKYEWKIESTVMKLIHTGFDSDEVFKLVDLIQRGVIKPDKTPEKSLKEPSYSSIKYGNKDFRLPFTRMSLERVFNNKFPWYYVIFAMILAFSTSAFIGLDNNMFKSNLRWIIALYGALSTFSMLHQPIVDPYCTTIDDISICFTRSFFLSLFSGLLYLFDNLNDSAIIIDYYQYIIDLSSLYDTIGFICKYLIYLFPLTLILDMVCNPIMFFVWLFEWVNRYLFGSSGETGFYSGFIDLARNIGLVFIVREFIKLDQLVLIGPIVSLIVQIPSNIFRYQSKHKNQFIKLLIWILISPFPSIAAYYTSINANNEVIQWICFSWFLVFDVIIPYMNSNQFYLIFHMQVFPPIIIINWIQCLTPCFFAPLLAYSAIRDSPVSKYIEAMIYIHCIRIAFSKPYILFVSSLLAILVLPEFNLNNSISINLEIGLLISEKLINIFLILDIWLNWKWTPPILMRNFNSLFEYPFVEFLVSFVRNRIFTPDNIILTPSALWSLITGSPIMLIGGQPSLASFSSPRSNFFWNCLTLNMPDTQQTLARSLIDFPVEALVYNSLTEQIQAKLSNYIKSGRFGAVNDGDFFLFVGDNVNAIIHIIQIDSLGIAFQLRGLEYTGQMSCHETELNALNSIVENYHEKFGIEASSDFKRSFYEMKAKDIVIKIRGSTHYAIDQSFIGITPNEVISWFFIAICYTIKDEIIHPEDNQEQYNMEPQELNIIRKIGIDEQQIIAAQQIMQIVIKSLIKNNEIQPDALYELFSGEHQPSVITKSIRFGVSLAFLASAGLAPNLEYVDEILCFLQTTHRSVPAMMVNDEKFVKANKKEDKTVISICFHNNEPRIVKFQDSLIKFSVFKLQSELVRGLWANEACTQLFYLVQFPERNSIQRSVKMLRNIINQSCDKPIGYPAYVSPILISPSTPFSLPYI